MLHASLRVHWRAISVAAIFTLLAATLPFSILTPSPALGDSDWVVTSLADDGTEGTLRYAVDNSDEGDTITFDSSLRGTITLDCELGQLIVDHPLTIEGPGAGRLTVSGADETRVFFIKGPKSAHCQPEEGEDGEPTGGCCSVEGGCEPGDEGFPGRDMEELGDPDVTISGLTIADGFPKYMEPFPCIPADPLKDPHGPACFGGNVLCVRENVALINCIIKDGLAEQGGGISVRNNAALLLQDCTVRDNEAGDTGTDFPRNGQGNCDSSNSGGGIDIRNYSTVLIEDSTIAGNTAQDGGGIAVTSRKTCHLTVRNSTISDNTTAPVAMPDAEPGTGGNQYGDCGSPLHGGAGIFAKRGSLLFEDCIIERNVAQDDWDMYAFGGGILLKKTSATITRCTVTENKAGNGHSGGIGGGIACLNSEVRIDTCTITLNEAGDECYVAVGGGVYAGQGRIPSPLPAETEPGSSGYAYPTDIVDTLIANNTAGSTGTDCANGGGIASGQLWFLEVREGEPGDEQYWYVDQRVNTALTNCTISGNASIARSPIISFGGGVAATGSKSIALSFCTVTENEATYGGGLSSLAPPASSEPGECPYKLRMKNSIVAGNTSYNSDSDIDEGWMSWEGNVLCLGSGPLSSEPGDCFCGSCGDVYITGDPMLGPLADNGGPTLTHAVLPGSPALDAACDCRALSLVPRETKEPAGTIVELQVEADQRGCPRPTGDDPDDMPDAGAFECQPDIDLPDVSGNSVNAGQTSTDDCTRFPVRVQNAGSSNLVISDMVIPGSSEFELLDDYSGVVLGPGESIIVYVRFCPTLSGPASATLRIVSNDPDEAPLEVTLRGIGKSPRDRSSEPASMTTNYLVVDPVQVLPGQEVTVSANVCNGGGEDGSQTASLAVNGAAEQSQTVTVSAGACQQVTFRVARSVPGTYNVSIDGMQGQFTVLAPRVVQASVPSQQDNGLGTAGIIAIVVVVIVLIGAVVFIFKQN